MKTSELRSDDTGDLPERAARLRERTLGVTPSISIHRARAVTEVARAHAGLPIVLQKARGIYRTCETLPIYIDDDELIVGHAGGKPRTGVFSPDTVWRWLDRELETVHQRSANPFVVSEEDKEILRSEIFPFWEGRSVEETVYRELDELGLLAITRHSGIIDCEVKSTSGGGDLSPGYANVLFEKGFCGIKRDANDHIAQLELWRAEDLEKYYFLRAVTIICDAMMLLGQRYSDLARAMAAKESEPKRRRELEAIADVCREVPANPPRSFQEALQMIWFGQMSLLIEENSAGTSPGRVDQYVYPFLQSDLESGDLDEERAREILYCFLIKLNEVVWVLSEFGSYYFAGYMPFQNLCVGGVDRAGRDATNPLTHMLIDCVKNLGMFQPSLSVRIHRESPPGIMAAIAELTAASLGMPAILCDEAMIEMIRSRGVSLEDARDYCIMGCSEPHIHGKLVRWASACYVNFPIAIELALNNGVHLKSGQRLGLATGELEEFASFEELEAAVREQLSELYRICAITTVICQKAHQRLLPKPVGSALTEGCVESGRGYMRGGAAYNSGPGVICVGTADYADSMYAIKKLVYDEKKISLAQLAQALAADFEGYAEIHALCVNAPKFGNDIDEVDRFATEIVDFASDEVNSHRGLFAPLELGTLPVSTHIPQGLVVGALPSGRRAGLPLADGISPSQGTDRAGPTAVLRSANKINPVSTSLGTLLNMKISPELLATEAGRATFVALLRAHERLGGIHVQFNCVTRDQLIEAQKQPEQHRGLVVRVAGYSAYFTELCPEVQDEIISRTQYTAWG